LPPALTSTVLPTVLARIGTDGALMDLVTMHLALKKKTASTAHKRGTHTEAMIERIADKRGIDVDVLLDELIPIRAFDEEGSVPLDLGGGFTWRVSYDAQLRRILRNEDNVIKELLPHAKIDPLHLKAVKALLGYLEEDVHTISEVRSISLERAMIDGRSFSADVFRRVWMNHPFVRHMARGVLWELLSEDSTSTGTSTSTSTSFRIAEDFSLAGIEDKPLSLTTSHSQRIGVTHPARLSAETRARWRTTFADYELLQPFEQLEREPPQMSANDLDATSIERPVAHPHRMPPSLRSLAPLEHAGFLDSTLGFVIPFGPRSANAYGIIARQKVTVAASLFVGGRAARFRDVDDVVRCEMMRALEIVCTAGEP